MKKAILKRIAAILEKLAMGSILSGLFQGKQKLKRVADFLEKLAVAGVALGLFQGNYSGMWMAAVFFVVSLILTREG